MRKLSAITKSPFSKLIDQIAKRHNSYRNYARDHAQYPHRQDNGCFRAPLFFCKGAFRELLFALHAGDIAGGGDYRIREKELPGLTFLAVHTPAHPEAKIPQSAWLPCLPSP